jgi:hemerythrin superfamily protein
MQTKLTLRIDKQLIQRAKRYSKKAGKSVSQLVSDYFRLLTAREGREEEELTPRVRRLMGALKGSKLSEEDYKRYLEEKYR